MSGASASRTALFRELRFAFARPLGIRVPPRFTFTVRQCAAKSYGQRLRFFWQLDFGREFFPPIQAIAAQRNIVGQSERTSAHFIGSAVEILRFLGFPLSRLMSGGSVHPVFSKREAAVRCWSPNRAERTRSTRKRGLRCLRASQNQRMFNYPCLSRRTAKCEPVSSPAKALSFCF
jgi:hypothetical protein